MDEMDGMDGMDNGCLLWDRLSTLSIPSISSILSTVPRVPAARAGALHLVWRGVSGKMRAAGRPRAGPAAAGCRQQGQARMKDLFGGLGVDLMNEVGAIVLGGGRGTRLYPLTRVRSKPAVPLCGRYRLVDIPLSNCIHSGILRILVLTQFNSHSLNRHIKNTYKFDEFSGGSVEILAAEQTNEIGDWFQGTADAVRKHLLHIRQRGLKHFLILSGDQLYRMDYRTLLDTHLRNDADITVAALPVDREAAKSFGIMKVARSGEIRRFVEKPREDAVLDQLVTPAGLFKDFGLEPKGREHLASMGVYAFKAEVLEELLVRNPSWVDFGKEIIPGALKTHRVFSDRKSVV